MLHEAAHSPAVGRTLKAAHQAARTIPNTEIVKAGELVEARFARGVSPSTASRKVLALLIQKAAGDAWKPGLHSIPKRELRGTHRVRTTTCRASLTNYSALCCGLRRLPQTVAPLPWWHP